MSIRGFVCLAMLLAALFVGTPAQAFAGSGGLGPTDISQARVEPIPPQAFAGGPVEPKVGLSLGGRELKPGVDFIALYSDNVWPGKAHVVALGRGLCSGIAIAEFRIMASYVMVGDSYATCDEVTWPEVLAGMLGLNRAPARAALLAESGFGFAVPGRQFALLGGNSARDAGVSDVLVVGGAGNDIQAECSMESVDAWYRLTITVLRLKYPNARIMHAVPNWNFPDERYCITMVDRLPLYRSLAEACGVHYLPSCEGALRASPDLMQPDGNHPNAEGAHAIAAAITQDIDALNAACAAE